MLLQTTYQPAKGDIQEIFCPFAGVYEELKVFAEDVAKCVFQVTILDSAVAALVNLGEVKETCVDITLLVQLLSRTRRMFFLDLQLCWLPSIRSDAAH